jgi:hypothetical protein
MVCYEIPCSTEQGIFCMKQGILGTEQGIVGLSVPQGIKELPTVRSQSCAVFLRGSLLWQLVI